MKATHAEKNAEIQGIIGNLSVYQSELISEHLLSSHNEAITATKTLFFLYAVYNFGRRILSRNCSDYLSTSFYYAVHRYHLTNYGFRIFQERYPIVLIAVVSFICVGLLGV